MKQPIQTLRTLWSATSFACSDLSGYAERFMADEARRGVMLLGGVSLLLLAGAALLYSLLGFGTAYIYTCAVLAVLSLHVMFSARSVTDLKALYLLGIALLVVSGVAFVLLAHHTGTFSTALLANVVVLFMVVPMVPWGLREAALVILLIYMVFSVSTLSVTGRFDSEILMVLQFLMFAASLITLVVVARNVGVRKHDIQVRFDLENAHREMEVLSNKDPLTGAWNRRFLELNFSEIAQRHRDSDQPLHLALLDIDDFKQLNDTRGHDHGDRILKHVTTSFQQALGADGYVVRLGGDEFALLFGSDHPLGTVEKAIKSVQAAKELRHEDGAPIQMSTLR